MRKSRKNRRDLGLLRSESEDDPRGFENISNGVPGTPRSFTIDSYTEAVSKEGEEEQNVATTAKRSHSKKVTQEEFVRNGLTSSDEEDDMRVVKLPIQSEAPEKLPIIQDTNRLNNISSEDEATSIRREVADGSQGIDMSTFRSVNQTLAYLLKAFSRSAGSLHRDVSSEYSHQSIHQQLQSVANCVTSQSERSNGPRGRETLMSSPRYANTAPRRSDPSSPRSRHGCVKDEILDGYNYRSSSGSRSRHRDEASRSRSRHRDGSSRSRSRHRDGPSRSRSRHRDEVSRSRSRHSAEASDQKIEVGPSHCLRMCSSGSSSTFCLISAIVLPANSPSLQSFTLTRWRPWKTL
ncbi:pre-mRNA-splicing factor CWC21-like isoform X2 [Poecilia latipinna]|uniref:pre-mRNA-splicing factor CWC21-like isoform X2 n=1 Tax=Poecilia latipinna TaxID=48699 RepID=UPI00072E988E|nr:PREDICTED: pre-mRNA-splicing factor CWC21-like isoform X2 [Poecilia latipinna]